MTALITGGAGFIGSHLAERMLAGGDRVIILDDLSTGSTENLSGFRYNPRMEFVKGSVLDAALVDSLVGRSDIVVHLAAAVGVRQILNNPLASIHTNVGGTETVLNAAATFRRKILVASTSEVYGKNESDKLCETADSVLGTSSVIRWSYATAKKLDEFLALAYAAERGIPVIVTRFFNIVGPRQRSRYGMVLPNFIRAALRDAPIPVFGDGTQTRNFTFIRDCIDAMMRLLSSPAGEGQVINIGGREEISILDLARRVRAITGSSSPIVKVPYSEAYPGGGFEDMRRRVPCICKIGELVGWSPVTRLDDMILETARFERQRAESLVNLAQAVRPEHPVPVISV